ncbi:MAG: DUF309 domain-containing protein [Bdellovibrionales bacterium]|nr:DUF309 domain-containing protein [Bdellovibrionales bacterium]
MTKRLVPTWPFPAYVFIPGVNPHPKKVGGHMEGQPDPVAPQIDLTHPEKSEFLRYSLDLYNHGYYWESHVYFEALWNAHGRTGSVADLLKGMIKLGAAGVKILIHQPQNARDHLVRAKELFESVMNAEGSNFLGFELKQIIANMDEVLDSQESCPKVSPSWE